MEGLGKKEPPNTDELHREDIEALSKESIKILKALIRGFKKPGEIASECGISIELATKELEKLRQRKFVSAKGTRNVSYFPTKKARLIMLKKSHADWLLYSGLVASFFAGIIEFSRFVSLFAPLRFKGRPSEFWMFFYSKASWIDGILTFLILLVLVGFGYLIIERKEKERMIAG